MAFRPVGFLFVLMSILNAGLTAVAAQSAISVRAPKAKTSRTTVPMVAPVRPSAIKASTSTPITVSKAPIAPSKMAKAEPVSNAVMNTSISVAAVPPAKPAASKFGILASFTGGSNMYKQSSPDHEAFTELVLIPSYTFSEEISLSLKSIITHEETKARNTTLSDSTLTVKFKGPQLTQNISSSGRIFGVLPTNEESRKNDRFQGATGLRGDLKWEWKKLEANYSLIGTRNFHEFTVNAEDSPNIQYGLSQLLTFEVKLTPEWSVSTEGFYKQARTYKDFDRQSYTFDADVNYSLNKMWTFNVGLSSEGSALKANGIGSNIKVYDENTSVIRAGVTFVN